MTATTPERPESPSPEARKAAHRATGCEGVLTRVADLEHDGVCDQVAIALDAAREQGRLEGLEQAASMRTVLRGAVEVLDEEERHLELSGRLALLRDRVRALATEEPKG